MALEVAAVEGAGDVAGKDAELIGVTFELLRLVAIGGGDEALDAVTAGCLEGRHSCSLAGASLPSRAAASVTTTMSTGDAQSRSAASNPGHGGASVYTNNEVMSSTFTLHCVKRRSHNKTTRSVCDCRAA